MLDSLDLVSEVSCLQNGRCSLFLVQFWGSQYEISRHDYEHEQSQHKVCHFFEIEYYKWGEKSSDSEHSMTYLDVKLLMLSHMSSQQ